MSLSTTTDSTDARVREAVSRTATDAIMSQNPFGSFMKIILLWVMSIFSLTVEVLLRRNFGERYLPMSAVVTSAVAYLLLILVNRGPGFNVLAGAFSLFPRPGLLAWLFLLVFIGAGAWHRYRTFRRNWYTGPAWHSYAAGDSWLRPVTAQWRDRLPFVPVMEATQRYIEPAAVVLVGLVLMIVDGFLGGWLVIAGLCLLVKEQLKHQGIRNAYLNLVDSQLEAQAMTELLKTGWNDLSAETPANPAEKVRRNGYTAYIPIPIRTAEQRQAAVATLEGMFPAEMQAARTGESRPSNWQQAKARQLNGATESSATSPGTGDD